MAHGLRSRALTPLQSPAMNPRLLRTCVILWALGLLGLCVARALFALELAELPCRLATSLWIVGGLGYTSLGTLALVMRAR